MIASNYQVRRATVDDLAALRKLWQQANLPVAALEKRLTEFQVAETAQGDVLGALGLQIAGSQARIHSEAYRTMDVAIEILPRLWERVQSVARHQGLSRLWVKHGASFFWLEMDFQVAGSDELKTLPAGFADGDQAHWMTFKLREDSATGPSLDKELELFRQFQKAESAKLALQARNLRALAAGVAIGALVLMMFAIWYILRHLKRPL
jgi:N-acetylglutamate synthase-like GNAT family acetyltransferase